MKTRYCKSCRPAIAAFVLWEGASSTQAPPPTNDIRAGNPTKTPAGDEAISKEQGHSSYKVREADHTKLCPILAVTKNPSKGIHHANCTDKFEMVPESQT